MLYDSLVGISRLPETVEKYKVNKDVAVENLVEKSHTPTVMTICRTYS